ncbi:hypothetical protein [Streptomyces sp. FxanaA7]|uniref:hypothetical protein n=1 Tax=Streptomyces sp. FxanaA7 TaxID=1265492 RepID=UPI0005EE27FD|nr:hypothetical protein [Streptomyces sp. FxanaA7]
MGADETAREVSTVMHVRCPDQVPEAVYREVLEQLAELSPVVQALPPSAALVELRRALPYFGVDAHRLGQTLRVRAGARLGIDLRIGIEPTMKRAGSRNPGPPCTGT